MAGKVKNDKKINKIATVYLLIVIVSCSSTKKTDINDEYKNYRITQVVKLDSVLPFQHFKDFLTYKKEQNRKSLLNDPYLKTNKVYVYQGGSIKNTFCIFSDDGNEYLARIYKADSLVLTKPENGIVKLKRAVKLEFLGNFELTDTVIKISRNIRELFGKEYNECDIGILQKNTLRLIENYDTKLYSYKKKWLAKRYKTNYKLVYQPNLKATRIEATKTRNPSYLVEGSFALEEN